MMKTCSVIVATCLCFGQAIAQGEETNAAAASTAETIVISAAQPLAASNTELRKQVARLCKEMLAAPAGQFKSHPSAAQFPGPVATNAPRISRAIRMNHVPPRNESVPVIKALGYSNPLAPTLHSTGLYAAPGDEVTVHIPEELSGKVSVQIGCHTDNLNQWVAAREDWRRMPLVVKRQKLETAHTQVSNPFGGLVYITCAPMAEPWEAEIGISNAVMAPWFVLGKTSLPEWKQMLETTGAPWGEMGASNVIVMLPVRVLKTVGDPEARMQLWEKVIGAIMDLAQLPMPFYRPQRLVTDVHIGGGFMHSGYPIMIHHCPEKRMFTEDFVADPARFFQPAKGGPNWGFFHEIGHNMQNLDWVFDGTTEVSVNLFSLYCFDKVVGGRDDAHPGVSNESTRKMLNKYFSKPADFETWKKDPFLGLVTFRLIQNDFGWELFKRTFSRYHGLGDEARPTSNNQKRDLLVRFLSESASRNFAPYFLIWGIPLSDELQARLKEFPEWMPYNFPPQPLERR